MEYWGKTAPPADDTRGNWPVSFNNDAADARPFHSKVPVK
jgi:hypothetical protein